MNDAFAWDIGDLAKFVLLRQLAGIREGTTRLRLGAVWCYTKTLPPSGHGRHTRYLSEADDYGGVVRERDPELYELLLAGSRSGRAIDDPAYRALLPHDTAHVFERLDGTVARSVFWRSALATTAGAQMVFFDPDNGFGPTGSRKQTGLHLSYDEVAPFYRRGQSLVIYQHQTREKGGLDGVAVRHARALSQRLGTEEIYVLRWRRVQSRLFFVVPVPDQCTLLEAHLRTLTSSAWGLGVRARQPDFTRVEITLRG